VSLRRLRARRADEQGFTLVELIMSIAILGVISTSIGVVGVVMFRTLNQTQARLNETRGPRFASVYWIPDVASTETVNPSSGLTDCGGAGLVTLRWVDDRTSTTAVTYAITTVGLERRMVRRLCTNNSSTPTRTTVIAPSIATPGAEVTCGNGTTYSGCSTDDSRKSLLLTLTPKNGGGTFSIDAYREVT
jgi:prepilin-type N-terminal cleavage/methylation domain-containing protein